MILLSIDTVAQYCAACILDTTEGRELGRKVVDLGRGHAERLIGVIDEALAEAGMEYHRLEAIAVNIGPGSFTGVRVGVSAARGFALALGIPAIGVSALEALAQESVDEAAEGPILAAIDAHRGEVYVQRFDASGKAMSEPSAISLADAEIAARSAAIVAGSAAGAMRELAGSGAVWRTASTLATADITVTARIAGRKGANGERPKPLYLRAPDAKPQSGAALPRQTA